MATRKKSPATEAPDAPRAARDKGGDVVKPAPRPSARRLRTAKAGAVSEEKPRTRKTTSRKKAPAPSADVPPSNAPPASVADSESFSVAAGDVAAPPPPRVLLVDPQSPLAAPAASPGPSASNAADVALRRKNADAALAARWASVTQSSKLLARQGSSHEFIAGECLGPGRDLTLPSEWTAEAFFKTPLSTADPLWGALLRGRSSDHHVIFRRDGRACKLGVAVPPANGQQAHFYDSGARLETLPAGWHHLAAVVAGGKTTFYVDGLPVGIANGAGAEPIAYIGSINGLKPFGRIADVRIWGRALSAAEVKLHASLDALPDGEGGLLLYFSARERRAGAVDLGPAGAGTLALAANAVMTAFADDPWDRRPSVVLDSSNTEEVRAADLALAAAATRHRASVQAAVAARKARAAETDRLRLKQVGDDRLRALLHPIQSDASERAGRSVHLVFTSSRSVEVEKPLVLPGAWTVEVFFKTPLAQDDRNWVTLLRGRDGQHHVLCKRETAADKLGVYMPAANGAAARFVDSGARLDTLNAGWHHLAAVVAGGKTAFYVDGLPVGVASDAGTEPISYIGSFNGAQPFGAIADLRIWGRARSAAELKVSASLDTLGGWEPDLLLYLRAPAELAAPLVLGRAGAALAATVQIPQIENPGAWCARPKIALDSTDPAVVAAVERAVKDAAASSRTEAAVRAGVSDASSATSLILAPRGDIAVDVVHDTTGQPSVPLFAGPSALRVTVRNGGSREVRIPTSADDAWVEVCFRPGALTSSAAPTMRPVAGWTMSTAAPPSADGTTRLKIAQTGGEGGALATLRFVLEGLEPDATAGSRVERVLVRWRFGSPGAATTNQGSQQVYVSFSAPSLQRTGLSATIDGDPTLLIGKKATQDLTIVLRNHGPDIKLTKFSKLTFDLGAGVGALVESLGATHPSVLDENQGNSWGTKQFANEEGAAPRAQLTHTEEATWEQGTERRFALKSLTPKDAPGRARIRIEYEGFESAVGAGTMPLRGALEVEVARGYSRDTLVADTPDAVKRPVIEVAGAAFRGVSSLEAESISASESLTAKKDATVMGSLKAQAATIAKIDGAAALGDDGKLTVSGPVTVTGKTTFKGDVDVDVDPQTSRGGKLTLKGALSVDGEATLKGGLEVDADKKTTLKGPVEVGGNFTAKGVARAEGGLTVSLTQSDTLKVGGAAVTVDGAAQRVGRAALTVVGDAVVTTLGAEELHSTKDETPWQIDSNGALSSRFVKVPTGRFNTGSDGSMTRDALAYTGLKSALEAGTKETVEWVGPSSGKLGDVYGFWAKGDGFDSAQNQLVARRVQNKNATRDGFSLAMWFRWTPGDQTDWACLVSHGNRDSNWSIRRPGAFPTGTTMLYFGGEWREDMRHRRAVLHLDPGVYYLLVARVNPVESSLLALSEFGDVRYAIGDGYSAFSTAEEFLQFGRSDNEYREYARAKIGGAIYVKQALSNATLASALPTLAKPLGFLGLEAAEKARVLLSL
jgi:hypothetical protein